MKPAAAMNVYEKVAIIRRPTDSLTYEDPEGNVKTVSDLGHAAATATPLATNKPKHDIPVPQIKFVETYNKDVPNNYEIQKSFVRYHRPSDMEWKYDNVEYVADIEDETWLANNTKFGGACNRPITKNITSTTNDGNDINNDNKQQANENKDKDDMVIDDGDNAATKAAAAAKSGSQDGRVTPPTMGGNPVLTAAMTTPDTKTLQHQRRPQLRLSMLEHALDILEKETAFDIIVSQSQAEKLLVHKIPELYHLFPVKHKRRGSSNSTNGDVTTSTTAKNNTTTPVPTISQVIQDIYNYWVQKRSKLKRPLLRRYWPVTSSDDTNPHLVFRPREKEKYKLRKKRQNDMDAYRKMKQLRTDFENLRLLLDLTKRREELHRSMIQMQCDLFEQQLFDLTDTSATPRVSQQLRKRDIDSLSVVPSYYDVSAGTGNKKGRRGRKAGSAGGGATTAPSSRSVSPVPSSSTGGGGLKSIDGSGVGPTTGIGGRPDATPSIVAGQNFGEPAPNFLHPLLSRETYVTSWQNAVPHVSSYINAQPTPTYRFRHRPRVGRGGRLNIDRLPYPSHPAVSPRTVFTAGKGLPRRINNNQPSKGRLLDLLPEPLDHKVISRRIEDISVAALKEDLDRASGIQPAPIPGAPPPEPEDHDGDEVLVKLDDWLETDEQLWGEERYAIGPI